MLESTQQAARSGVCSHHGEICRGREAFCPQILRQAGDPQPLPPGGQATTRPRDNANLLIAKAVATTIGHSLQEAYGDAVNVRCDGSVDGAQCVLAASWNRGREVFYRRYTYPADLAGGLPAIGRRVVAPLRAAIDSTQGAERP